MERRDIKTVQLLYPSMAKMEAKAQGADDAWLQLERLHQALSAASGPALREYTRRGGRTRTSLAPLVAP